MNSPLTRSYSQLRDDSSDNSSSEYTLSPEVSQAHQSDLDFLDNSMQQLNLTELHSYVTSADCSEMTDKSQDLSLATVIGKVNNY